VKIATESLEYATQGFCDIIDLTEDVGQVLRRSKLKEGSALIFV